MHTNSGWICPRPTPGPGPFEGQAVCPEPHTAVEEEESRAKQGGDRPNFAAVVGQGEIVTCTAAVRAADAHLVLPRRVNRNKKSAIFAIA